MNAWTKSLRSKSSVYNPPTLGWSKIKECLHYNFGSVATKQCAASMFINQQQKSSATLLVYVQRFFDFLLKSSGLLPHSKQRTYHTSHTSLEICIIRNYTTF